MRKTIVVSSENGQSLVELAFVLPVLLLILLGIVDFGRAYYVVNELTGAAQAGAVYGVQNPTDTAGMQTAAKDNAPDVSSSASDISAFAVAASSGCECSNGTSASSPCTTPPTCSTNAVLYVKVTASASYKPLFPWPGIPKSIPLSKTVTMRTSITQ